MKYEMTEGTVAFSNVDECDVYNGKSTGRYTLVVTIDEADASKMRDKGIKVKMYQPEEGPASPQRKFASNFKPPVVDLDNNPVTGEIPFGSKVRIAWEAGPDNPQYGVPCYMARVRVLERAESLSDIPEEF